MILLLGEKIERKVYVNQKNFYQIYLQLLITEYFTYFMSHDYFSYIDSLDFLIYFLFLPHAKG